jgi:hypothetical protein
MPPRDFGYRMRGRGHRGQRHGGGKRFEIELHVMSPEKLLW